MRRTPAVLGLTLAAAATAVAQDATQAEIERTGFWIMAATFALIAAGALGMWLVNHLYHPPGETQRAKSRRD